MEINTSFVGFEPAAFALAIKAVGVELEGQSGIRVICASNTSIEWDDEEFDERDAGYELRDRCCCVLAEELYEGIDCSTDVPRFADYALLRMVYGPNWLTYSYIDFLEKTLGPSSASTVARTAIQKIDEARANFEAAVSARRAKKAA